MYIYKTRIMRTNEKGGTFQNILIEIDNKKKAFIL